MNELEFRFNDWWRDEGSLPPNKNEDHEEHTKRMCRIAWLNGADVDVELQDKKLDKVGW